MQEVDSEQSIQQAQAAPVTASGLPPRSRSMAGGGEPAVPPPLPPVPPLEELAASNFGSNTGLFGSNVGGVGGVLLNIEEEEKSAETGLLEQLQVRVMCLYPVCLLCVGCGCGWWGLHRDAAFQILSLHLTAHCKGGARTHTTRALLHHAQAARAHV